MINWEFVKEVVTFLFYGIVMYILAILILSL